MNDQNRNGTGIENLVEIICNKMFFSDFVVRNPKYTKNKGPEKEAADLLVPFHKYLLAFQVKSKIELTKVSKKSRVDKNRISNVVTGAVNQLKTIRRVIDNDWLCNLKTVRGFDIPISSAYENVIGIVVVDLIGEEYFPKNERTRLVNNYLYKYDMPIHIFMRNEFELLSSELDTLPDFVRFLDSRRQIINLELLKATTPILDYLAFYKTKPEIIKGSLTNSKKIQIEDSLWDVYQDKFASTIEKRNKLNEPSYIIDEIIEQLHTTINIPAFEHIEKEIGLKKKDGIDGYLTVARELATLPRLERRFIGERFLHCMRQAESKDRYYHLFNLTDKQKAYLILSMKGGHSDRQSNLYHLCSMAYCLLGVQQIIGVATAPLNSKDKSYDVIGLNGAVFENPEELAKQAEENFSKPYKPNITEYQGRVDDA